MTCPVCGTVTVPGARFCHNCGVALPAAAALPAAERRVVTVLFGDLSDFTAWAEGVDPERVGAVTDRVLAALAGAVKTFGGHVDKLTGDGIMAVFGAPVTHEDDPERSVRAALAMQRAVRRVLDDERGGGAPAGLRIGINTGDVVAGVQASLEYTVIGDTVNTAARLADAATVGSVYAGAMTAGGTRHVASWRRLLPLRLKGKRQAVEAYELLGPLDAPGTRSGLGDEGPFVGRETEMALVSNRLVEVADRGVAQVLVFTADAGVGKSRLAAEVARVAFNFMPASASAEAASGARVLSVRCAAYGESWRLGPLADLVRVALGLPDQPNVAVTRAMAEERLRRVGQIVERRTGVAPKLQQEHLLSLLGYADPPALDHDRGMSAERPGLIRRPADADAGPAAAAELLSALAAEAPLVVIVDDLHDASPPSVDSLGAMLNRLVGPVLVVLYGRPELVRSAGALTRLADAEVHALAPLRGAEMARLLSAYLGGGRLPGPDTDRLLTTAQGNPFYLAELVTLLIERGALTRAAGGGWLLAAGSLSGRLLSRDLAAVLAARIDALPADSRSVLRDAAVVGDIVPQAALAAVHDPRSTVDTRPAAVTTIDQERALDELLHRRMLLPTRGGYQFATPLMREAAYAGVGKADLADRHAYLVRWAASLSLPVPSLGWSADTLDGFIADQAERAASLADAVSLRPDAPVRSVVPFGVAALGRLGRRAIMAGEPGQSAHFMRRALALSGGVLPPPDRLTLASARLQLGQLTEALGDIDVLMAGAGPDPRESASAGAGGGGGGGTDARDADPESRARAYLLAGRAYHMLGDLDRGDRAWQEALEVATAADLPAERAEALRRIGMEDYRRGRLREAQAGFQEALAIAEGSGDRRGQAWALQNLAWVATTLGDFTSANRALAVAARLFAELQNTTGRAWLRGTTAFSRLLAGRLHEARRLASAFLPFGERVGERWAVGTLRAVEAFAAAELGELAEADRGARRAYREFDEIDDDWGRAFSLVVRGVVARGLGEPAHAMDLLTDACRFGERTGHPLLLGIAYTIRGFTALDLEDPATAAADAHAVLAAVKPHDVGEAARVGPRVLLGLARLAEGDIDGALCELSEVAEIDSGPSLLLSRRQAVAAYSRALLAAGRVDEAVAAARRAAELPSEDVRGRVVADRVLAAALAAAGDATEAREAATAAVRTAYATQQVSERPAADAALAALRSSPVGTAS